MMCSDPERDSHRFMDMIVAAARDDKAKLYTRFQKWSEVIAKRARPKNPLKPKKKTKKQADDDQALIKAIKSVSYMRLANTPYCARAVQYGLPIGPKQ